MGESGSGTLSRRRAGFQANGLDKERGEGGGGCYQGWAAEPWLALTCEMAQTLYGVTAPRLICSFTQHPTVHNVPRKLELMGYCSVK